MAHRSLARISTKRSQAATRAYLEAQRIFKLAARADKAGMRGDARKLYGKAKRLHARAEASGLMMGPVGTLPNPRGREGLYLVKQTIWLDQVNTATDWKPIKARSKEEARQQAAEDFLIHGPEAAPRFKIGQAKVVSAAVFNRAVRRRNPVAVDEWDIDDGDVDVDAAFKLGTQQARALGRSAREHRAGLKLYKGGYYSRLRDKYVEFVRPIEAHSAAEAKAQVKAMVTNEKPVNVTAKEISHRSSRINTDKRKRKNPTVGEKISELRHEGVPQDQAVAIAFSEKRAGKVNPNYEDKASRPWLYVDEVKYEVLKSTNVADAKAEGYTHTADAMREAGIVTAYWLKKPNGRAVFIVNKYLDGHYSKPVKISGIRWDNPGLVDLAANLQAAEFLTGGGRKRKRNPREYKTVSTHTLKGLREAERLKAAGWRIVSSGLFRVQFERDRPQRKRRKRNPSIHKLSETFQGKANGAITEYKGSNSAPGDLARIGRLIELHVDNAVMRLPGTMVAADKQAKLWLVSKRAPVFQTKAKRGERLNAGQITRIVYLTAKSHVEGGKLTEYDHRFDEPYPYLLIDHEGMPIVSGGKYRIRREGIVG